MILRSCWQELSSTRPVWVLEGLPQYVVTARGPTFTHIHGFSRSWDHTDEPGTRYKERLRLGRHPSWLNPYAACVTHADAFDLSSRMSSG